MTAAFPSQPFSPKRDGDGHCDDRVSCHRIGLPETAPSAEAAAVEEDEDAWLAPLFLDERAAAYGARAAAEVPSAQRPADGSASRPFPSPRVSDKGFLPMTLDEYLTLLDWSGRQVRRDNRGAIPEHLAPILERLHIAAEHWIETVCHFGRLFHTAAGGLSAMRGEAHRRGRRRLYGMRHSAVAFPSVSA